MATIQPGLLSATDAVLEDAVAHADPMLLRGLLYQVSGDESLIDLEIGRQAVGNFFSACVVDQGEVAKIRAKALALLKSYRDAGPGEVEIGSPERLVRSLGLAVDGALPEAEYDIWLEQTALDPWARGVTWPEPPTADQLADFKVAVIGTGLSGLNAAVHLKRAGIPFVAFEKNSEVGGAWFENRYPGARVDSPSRTYTHLFGVDFPYPYAYCPRDENLAYMRWTADAFGLRDDIVFNTEVKSLVWDEAAEEWELTTVGPDGRKAVRANAVISCVGFLARPQLPEIAGMDSFQGVACHTAQWPDGLDVAGKRVAVIGSGASGYQTTPEIAKTAGQVDLYQRTPSWCFDNPAYVSQLPDQALWLDRNFPFYVNFARFRLSWIYGPDGFALATRIDPAFDDPHARSAINKRTRDARVAFVERKLANRPDLIAKMIPEAPPMSSRPVMIDSQDSIFEALLRDNVELVTDPIEKIAPAGIRAGGVERAYDIIVYATGFRANEFLWPMEVRGRGGATVEELWAKDGPRAYIGAMLPGFPNFFMSYGPNTNNFGGFQVIDLLEMEIRFALQCIAGLIVRQERSVDVRPDAYQRFNEELDREEQTMIYMDARAHNYYQNGAGRSCVNGPIDFRRMWRWLRDPTGLAPNETDAGVRPYFGEDLVTG